ncbi:MAG TPA: D-glycerate dehydrogenase [Longimicrobiales bacterium]|nr:D-glycerate dehydrogenase [Longimicrobiales bacterium]
MAEPLRAFLERTAVPSELVVELLAEDAPLPEGPYVGLIPLITRPVTAEALDALPSLRVIANYGVGTDNIDVAAARARGIGVSNTPDVLTGATAELAWALILAVARRLPEAERVARSGVWGGWRPTELLGMGLEGRTLGIVGAGRIGREVARRAPAFGMGVLYTGRERSRDWERESGAEWRDLPELLEEADVVSLHVSLTPQTRGLIGRDALAGMKQGAILVNTSRGAVIDEDALAEALVEGRLRGAGLDVHAEEPLLHPRLRELPQVVLLPHIGSATEGARHGMWEIAWGNLLRGVRHEALLTPVAP